MKALGFSETLLPMSLLSSSQPLLTTVIAVRTSQRLDTGHALDSEMRRLEKNWFWFIL